MRKRSRRPLVRDMLDDLELGFAITVHKAHGSQWPRVTVPVTSNRILDRTLLYTSAPGPEADSAGRGRSGSPGGGGEVVACPDTPGGPEVRLGRVAAERLPDRGLRRPPTAGYFVRLCAKVVESYIRAVMRLLCRSVQKAVGEENG